MKLEDDSFSMSLSASLSASKSSKSNSGGSCKEGGMVAALPGVEGSSGGLDAGDTRGDVCRLWGMVSLVSNTKKASPPSPSFMA